MKKYPIYYNGKEYLVKFCFDNDYREIKVYLTRRFWKYFYTVKHLVNFRRKYESYTYHDRYYWSPSVGDCGALSNVDHRDNDYYINMVTAAVTRADDFYERCYKREKFNKQQLQKLKEWNGVISSPTPGGKT